MEMLPSLTQLAPRQASSSPGSHRNTSNSASTLLSTLIPTFALAVVFVAVFFIFRSRYRRIYAPRTYVGVLRKEEYTPWSTKTGMFGWISEFKSLPDEFVLNHQSLDQYLYLRFFKMVTIMCFVGCCITWPVLFPINATGGGGQMQLDLLSFANVVNPLRYYAHVFVAWIYLGFVLFMITRETIYFINLRQAYLLSPRNASRISARTVLFTSVPKDFLNEGRLRSAFSGVRRVWVATDCKQLEKMVEKRDDAAFKLEKAEIKLTKMADDKRRKSKESATHAQEHDVENSGSIAAKYVPHKKRPTHKLTFLIGKKVDTIEWARENLPHLIQDVKTEQQKHMSGDKSPVGAVFIEFESQRAAQLARQMTRKELPPHMEPRCVGIPPTEIVWKNLKMGRFARLIRRVVATAIIILMILFWTIPVAFVGILSNINYITDKVPFLSFINKIPSSILGVVTGLLPVVLLALLMALVPKFCRFLAKQAGAVTLQQVELKTQSWYFAFQVIQVFLVTTFTSGAAAVATQVINKPGSAPMLLATNLPKASNFYIAYFVLYGLATSSKLVLNIVAFLVYTILGKFLDKTPRKMFTRYTKLTGLTWGSVYPQYTNLAVIALSYSCIAPLILGFATIGLGLLYLAFRYNSFYTYTTTIDTHGQAYGRALQQLTVGVYIAELCLIGLFAIGTSEKKSGIGPLVLMIIFLVATVIYHFLMRKKLNPLTRGFPKSLLMQSQEESDTTLAMEEGHRGHTEGEPLHPGFEKNGHADAKRSLSSKDEKADLPHAKKAGKQGGPLSRFFSPNTYASHNKLRETMQSSNHAHALPPYSEETTREAYLNPAIASHPPVLWIVRDEMGISRQEVMESSKAIDITDEGARFDAKGKVVWDQENVRHAPIWDEKHMLL